MRSEQPEASSKETVSTSRDLFAQRLVIGILQGILLYLLLDAAHNQRAIAKLPVVFFPLLLVTLYIAPVIGIGLNHLRTPRLALWSALLAVIVATLGYHDAWRAVEPQLAGSFFGRTSEVRLPSFRVTFYSGVIVFIGYALILAGEAARAWFAPYESYFEFSWKLALQICFSWIFVGTLHLVLWTGAALFMLIKLTFLQELLKQSWFFIPVSAMAFAGGLHITDVRPDFIRGTRTLLLTLMSWLLLLLVLIVAGFLASLPFTGFAPLWATRSAAWLLLSVAALKIVFINAVFKSGSASEPAPRILRICVRAACLMLPVLTILASYALALRINQYGLTNRRVLACASAFVAYCYALGYTWAGFDRRSSLGRLAPVNVLTAWVSLAVLFALFTPLADPARLSVNSQVDRLLAGRVTPEKFDFKFLRFQSGIYGLQALARLQAENGGPAAPVIRELSTQAAHLPSPGTINATAPDAVVLSRNIVSRTHGQELPASFITNDWQRATPQRWLLPACLNVATIQCDAYVVDLTDEHKPNVLLIPQNSSVASIFGQSPAGQWRLLGKLTIAPDCAGVRDALSRGSYRVLEPSLHDLEINGQRIQVEATTARGVLCHP